MDRVAKALRNLFIYYAVIIATATSLSVAVNGGAFYGFSDIQPGFNWEYIWTFLKMVGGFFGFGVTGFPVLASLVLFWSPAITFIVYIIGVIRGQS